MFPLPPFDTASSVHGFTPSHNITPPPNLIAATIATTPFFQGINFHLRSLDKIQISNLFWKLYYQTKALINLQNIIASLPSFLDFFLGLNTIPKPKQ